MLENVTRELNRALAAHADIRGAMGIIGGCPLFSRETKSAALGEISEHLVARVVQGQRRNQGNRGFDIVDAQGARIEVKSRLQGRWRDTLMFDFRKHTATASRVYCIVWKDDSDLEPIAEAYMIPVSDLISRWAASRPTPYCARTTLKKLREAASLQQDQLNAVST